MGLYSEDLSPRHGKAMEIVHVKKRNGCRTSAALVLLIDSVLLERVGPARPMPSLSRLPIDCAITRFRRRPRLTM